MCLVVYYILSFCFHIVLQELYLNNNYLKTLPECLSELKDLRVLNCSFNKLKKLPLSIGNMSGLEVLHLQGNPALCALPDTLALAQNIAELTLDIGRYIHPPNSVVMQGTFIIMDFLAKRTQLSTLTICISI